MITAQPQVLILSNAESVRIDAIGDWSSTDSLDADDAAVGVTSSHHVTWGRMAHVVASTIDQLPTTTTTMTTRVFESRCAVRRSEPAFNVAVHR